MKKTMILAVVCVALLAGQSMATTTTLTMADWACASPIGPLEITLCSNEKPKKVMLEPEHRPMKYTFVGGKIELTLPRLEIHSIIVIE